MLIFYKVTRWPILLFSLMSYVKRLHKTIFSQPRAYNGPSECQLHLLIASEIASDFINPFFVMLVAISVAVHFAQFMCQTNESK